jgi:predicted short-subunit dehydrogenase-like oxidoreductase (DUF2520 family)
MRELERIAVIGAGRLGNALSRALDAPLPLGRGADPSHASLILLCVPDAEIATAAAAVNPGPLVGHCSGATTLEPLLAAGHEAFSLHPLMTVPADGQPEFTGAAGAVAGSTQRARAAATALAERLGLRPIEIAEADRAAYHAAAAFACNFLTTVEGAAERLAATVGLDRAALVPLVRASVDAWERLGAKEAMTGPIVRDDRETLARHRAAIAERTPDLLPVYDVLVAASRDILAGEPVA